MKDFNSVDGIENMGGNIPEFLFSPVSKIASVPEPVNELITGEVTFSGSNDWYTGNSAPDSLEFTEEQADGGDGKPFSTRITGFLPRLSADMLALMREMSQTEHIVLITDKNGNVRLCGKKSAGLKFRFRQNTQLSAAGNAGYSFEFYLDHPRPSPCYVVE